MAWQVILISEANIFPILVKACTFIWMRLEANFSKLANFAGYLIIM